ncbi:MAG TPA: FAD-dependent oxidoreductase [Pyrinomonadaceae bacterium]|nr:FAD-dependent oxidoreductase [Pyrinomonadaceae bacterium]
MIGRANTNRREVTVVGAGISGMLAAYALDSRGYQVTLIEEKAAAGGLIRTNKTDFGLSESAAHSLIATEPVRQLCRDLEVELLSPRKGSKAKYIVRNGKLRRFPLTIGETLDTAGHAARARCVNGAAQNLDEWARRHLGNAALDYLLTPLVRGIYGVQPAQLGVSTAFPTLKLPVGKTLLGTLVSNRRKGKKKKESKQRVAPRFGMGDLVGKLEQRLEQRLGSRFRRGESVTVLPDAANVVLATPAYAAAKLLERAAPALAGELASVCYTPIVSVTTFVRREAFDHPIHGVGVLMPARENTKALGILFNSSSFEYRVADDTRLASFTVMMGGTSQPGWLSASDDEIRQTIKLELAHLLGIREPLAVVIHRWPAALPQYSVNLEKVWQLARETWCSQPGRILFGNYTGQISLRGIIESAMAPDWL